MLVAKVSFFPSSGSSLSRLFLVLHSSVKVSMGHETLYVFTLNSSTPLELFNVAFAWGRCVWRKRQKKPGLWVSRCWLGRVKKSQKGGDQTSSLQPSLPFRVCQRRSSRLTRFKVVANFERDEQPIIIGERAQKVPHLLVSRLL